MALSHNPDFEIHGQVDCDNSNFKKVLDDTQAKTEKTVEELEKEYKSLSSSIGGYQSALNKATEQYGETSEQVQQYTEKLEEQRKKQEEVRKSLESMGVSVENLGDSAQDEVQKAKNAFSRGSSEIGSIFSGLVKKITLGNLVSSAISKVTSTVVNAGREFISQGIEYNKQIENYTVAFTNMLGSVEAAETALSNIQHDAAVTPFSVEALTQANQLLIGAGENAEYAEKTIMALGDAVSATGGGSAELERMAANLQQVANVGKASSIDIKQFAYAGINIYQVLADYTGKSIQDVQDMTISYDVLSQALIAAAEEGGRYYDSMNTKSQTASGRLDTLKDNVKQLAGLMTSDLTDALGKAITKINEMVIAMQDAYKLGGWTGLIGKITGLTNVVHRAGAAFEGLGAVITALKNGDIGLFHGDWDSVYWKAFNNSLQNKNAGTKDDNYWKQYGDRLAKQYGLSPNESKSSIPSSTGGSGGSSGSSSTKENARQVTDTVTDTQKTIDGSIKTVTKLFDDGTKQVTTTTTKAGKKMVDGVERNVTTVETKVDEFASETATVAKETSTTVQKEITDIEEQAVKSLREVEKELKQNFTKETSEGILGILKDGLSDVKNKDWSGVALNVVKLIWGEVDSKQRADITAWAGNVLKVINDEYASGGLSSVGDTIKTLLSGGKLVLTTEEGTTALASFSEIISNLTASGGMGEVLGSLVTKLGAGFSSLAGNIGSVGTALSGLATKLVAVIAANPEIFAILAIVAGITALGVYIWKKHGKEISGWWSGLWADNPTAAPASNYKQSDSITAAKLVQASQAAAAANQQSLSSVQNSTGSAAAAQLNASWSGSSTTVLNIDGREVARTTAPYMDEELSFRS